MVQLYHATSSGGHPILSRDTLQVTYSPRVRARPLSFRPSLWQRIRPIVSKTILYLFLVWYVAEITGHGMDLRVAVRTANQWMLYYVQYSLWTLKRREIL
jgi:hypothetical protein